MTEQFSLNIELYEIAQFAEGSDFTTSQSMPKEYVVGFVKNTLKIQFVMYFLVFSAFPESCEFPIGHLM